MIEHFKELSTKIHGIDIEFQGEYFENEGALPPSLLITSPAMVVAIFAPDANKTWNEQHAASFKKAVRMINYVIQYHDTHQNLVVIYVAPDKEHYKNAERDFVNPSFTGGEYVLYLFHNEDIKKVDKILSLFENIEWRIETITFEEWLEAVRKIQDNKLVKEWLKDSLEKLLKEEIALDLRQVIIDSIRQRGKRQIEPTLAPPPRLKDNLPQKTS
ncbi:hypothetical protein MORE_26200 [Moorella thermoacetica]|nr:hypothetical protein MORE_26200 [Moorella thermoacetica]